MKQPISYLLSVFNNYLYISRMSFHPYCTCTFHIHEILPTSSLITPIPDITSVENMIETRYLIFLELENVMVMVQALEFLL